MENSPEYSSTAPVMGASHDRLSGYLPPPHSHPGRRGSSDLAVRPRARSLISFNLLISLVVTLLLLSGLLFTTTTLTATVFPETLNARRFARQRLSWMFPYRWLYHSNTDHNIDIPLSLIFAPILPVDAILEYDLKRYTETTTTTDGETITTVRYNSTHRVVGRYAAFSVVPALKMVAELALYPGDGCGLIDPTVANYTDKMVVIFRGNCSFYNKAKNVITWLQPKGVIVADTDAQRTDLITMYSRNGMGDMDGDKLPVPVLYVTHASHARLARFTRNKEPLVGAAGEIDLSAPMMQLTTIDDSRFFNVLISIIFSPPLLLFLIFLIVKRHERRQAVPRKADETFVRENLPVYIYDPKFLILQRDFARFTKMAPRLEAEFPGFVSPVVWSSLASIQSGTSQLSAVHSEWYFEQLTQLVSRLEGITLLVPSLRTTAVSHLSYFNTTKCSICLDAYEPWVSEVIPLRYCRHVYHRDCISEWIVKHNAKCPLCQDDITSHDYQLESWAAAPTVPSLATAATPLLGSRNVNLYGCELVGIEHAHGGVPEGIAFPYESMLAMPLAVCPSNVCNRPKEGTSSEPANPELSVCFSPRSLVTTKENGSFGEG